MKTVKKTFGSGFRLMSGERSMPFLVLVLCLVYFFRSFVMYIDIINPVGMEECHTGAVAREILKHGFAFPLEQYTPEYYENSILVGSLLTVVSSSVLGLNRLSVDFVPFVISLATLLLFLSMLIRAGYKSGLWFFIISYCFVSGTFIYLTMDSVGNHIIGLFCGVLILNRFYNAYLTRNPRYFYQLALLAGLSLFMHLGSMLYAGLCVLVYVLYRPAHGRRPRPGAGMLVKGACLFLLGSAPFLYFLLKTRAHSAMYLFGVFSRRSLGVHDWGAYARNNWDQFLFQFDNRGPVAALYLVMVALAWAGWLRIRKQSIPENTRFLHFIICLLPAPVFAAIIAFSGGSFTTYFTYLMPLLFLAGATVLSRLTDNLAPDKSLSRNVQSVLSLMLFAILISGVHISQINLSFRHAMHELTANENQAFCYWRFGRSFGNYVPYDGDSAKYASQILAACGRFDSKEKRDECLWGWSVLAPHGGFVLDEQAANALGPEAASLIARSIGGWTDNVLTCFTMEQALMDDCLLGMIERQSAIFYSFKTPGKPYPLIPCLPETPRFTGLMQEIRGHLRHRPWDNLPQNCPEELNMLCIMADAYCAANEKRLVFCDHSFTSPQDLQLCRFIFEQVWIAQEAEIQNNVPHSTAPR